MMTRYLPYLLSPVFYFLVALAGSSFTGQGASTWYLTINKPGFTPPGAVIGMIWTVIYILAALSLALFINAARDKPGFRQVLALYIVNGILNAAWSWFFFVSHRIGTAALDSALIVLTTAALMVLVWRYSRPASLLLAPYLAWVTFATYLNILIYTMNRQ